MKKLFLYSALAVLTMGLFNSCSKEDNGPAPDTTDYAEKTAGIYKGQMIVSVAGTAEDPTTQKIYMTRTADNKSTLEIRNFSYSGLSLGDIKIENVEVSAASKAEALSCMVNGKGTITIDLVGTPMSAEVTVSGTIVGKDAKLNIDVKMTGLNVNVKFTGDKIAQDTPDYALDIANTYSGSMTVSLGEPGKPANQKITFSRENENVVMLELKDFAFEGMNLGNIVLKGAAVTKSGDTYTVQGEDDIEVNIGSPVSAHAVLSGTVKEGKAELKIIITVTGLPEIVVDFTGATVPDATAELKTFVLDPAKVVTQSVSADGRTYTFYVGADVTADDAKALVPTITVSAGATVVPASGTAVDFSNGPVTFTVTAQDGTTKTEYTVVCGGVRTNLYSFEDWEPFEAFGTLVDGVEMPATASGWSTSLLASQFLPAMGVEVEKLAVLPVAGYAGKAAEINSIDSRAAYEPGGMVPALTSGTLFIGAFELDFTNTLASTHFGNPYARKPLAVSGYYKYTSGLTMVDNQGGIRTETVGVDECSMTAVLFEVTDPDETLDGTNLTTDPRVVAIKQFTSGNQAEFTPFTLNLEYIKDYNPEATYKFTIVCSSSKNGNLYGLPDITPLGAGGSSLVVDEISVIAEL